jgi:hypothetical protein
MEVGPRASVVCIAIMTAAGWLNRAHGAEQAGLPKLVFARQCSLWIWDQRGKETRLTEGFQDANPAVSPDGKTVVFERREPCRHAGILGRLSCALWVLALDSGAARRLLRAPGDCLTPSFDPGGKVVYFDHVWAYKPRDRRLAQWRESIGTVDLASRRWGDLRPLTRHVVEYEGRQYAFPLATADGRSILWSPVPHEGGTAHIYAAHTDGSARRVISGPRRRQHGGDYAYYFAVPSAGTESLVCLRGGEEYGAIAAIDRSGHELWHRTIAGLAEYAHPPAVSRRGAIAFEYRDSDRAEIWVLERGGETQRRIIADASQPAWVPGP